MRVSWLRCTAVAPALVWTVNANVEKTIFLGPRAAAISAVPNAPEGLDALRLASLSPAPASSILATQLPVRFPSASAPRGLESWYLLRGLDDGRRYEVRICWPATQPTDFWLDTFSIAHVLDTPDLISALARYSEGPQAPQIANPGPVKELLPPASESTLFLRIQAAASYYSTNRTLMEHPVPVHVDIILDPYILNVLPRSLAPTVAYIIPVAIGAWFLSGFIYRWLLSVANEPPTKPHTD